MVDAIIWKMITRRVGVLFSHGSTLDIKAGRLTGKVCDPILDHQAKLFFLQHHQATAGCKDLVNGR
jgi:phosphoserine phosphatase